jgi:Tol biopolymer transport system component
LVVLACPASGSARIAYSGGTKHKGRDIFIAQPNGEDVRRITDRNWHEWDPSWSPSGRRLVFGQYWYYKDAPRGLRLINANGKNRERLTSNPSDERPSWSPDGDRIVFQRGDELFVMNLHKRNPHPIVRATERLTEFRSPSWAPGGRRIVFEVLVKKPNNDRRDSEIFTIRRDGTKLRRLTRSPVMETQPEWSPDGRRILFGSKNRLVRGRKLREVHESDWSSTVYFGAAWSPGSGRMIFQDYVDGPSERDIFRIKADGSRLRAIVTGPQLVAGELDWN